MGIFDEHLQGLNQCELFEFIAQYIWDEVADNNKRGNRVDENGYTKNSLISLIQSYMELNQTNKVFAQTSSDEVTRGGDLEVYVEIDRGQYLRFILQAKTLKGDGLYHGVNRDAGSTKTKQWDALKNYSKTARSIPLYLFYNGIQNPSIPNSKDCNGDYSYKQLGCAIESPDEVISQFNTNNNLGFINNNVVFGKPWRKIPCCLEEWRKQIKTDNLKLYSPQEIDMDDFFKPFFSNFEAPSLGKLPPISFITNDKQSIRQLHNKLHSDGFQPIGRILINRKEQIKKTTKIMILG